MRVIIPVWLKDPDLINLTENAVKSLRENDVKITIIDNGSPVGGGALREWADEYVRNPINMGYAKAVNQGLKLHMGEIVAVANNDIRVSKNWLTVSKDILKDKSIGSVHFRMIPYDQPFNAGTQIWPTGKERWCSSSFFVVRAEQLYDENYFNTYDDWDFWYRFRKQLDYKTAYTNIAEYQHLDSSTVNRMERHEVTNKENHEYFKSKHGDYPENLWMKMYPEQMTQPWKPFE